MAQVKLNQTQRKELRQRLRSALADRLVATWADMREEGVHIMQSGYRDKDANSKIGGLRESKDGLTYRTRHYGSYHPIRYEADWLLKERTVISEVKPKDIEVTDAMRTDLLSRKPFVQAALKAFDAQYKKTRAELIAGKHTDFSFRMSVKDAVYKTAAYKKAKLALQRKRKTHLLKHYDAVKAALDKVFDEWRAIDTKLAFDNDAAEMLAAIDKFASGK